MQMYANYALQLCSWPIVNCILSEIMQLTAGLILPQIMQLTAFLILSQIMQLTAGLLHNVQIMQLTAGQLHIIFLSLQSSLM